MITFTITCASINCIILMNAILPMIPDSQFSSSTVPTIMMIEPEIIKPIKIANTTPAEYVKHEIPVCNDNSYLVWKGPENDKQPHCWEK